jgi:hypothetical protein
MAFISMQFPVQKWFSKNVDCIMAATRLPESPNDAQTNEYESVLQKQARE